MADSATIDNTTGSDQKASNASSNLPKLHSESPDSEFEVAKGPLFVGGRYRSVAAISVDGARKIQRWEISEGTQVIVHGRSLGIYRQVFLWFGDSSYSQAGVVAQEDSRGNSTVTFSVSDDINSQDQYTDGEVVKLELVDPSNPSNNRFILDPLKYFKKQEEQNQEQKKTAQQQAEELQKQNASQAKKVLSAFVDAPLDATLGAVVRGMTATPAPSAKKSSEKKSSPNKSEKDASTNSSSGGMAQDILETESSDVVAQQGTQLSSSTISASSVGTETISRGATATISQGSVEQSVSGTVTASSAGVIGQSGTVSQTNNGHAQTIAGSPQTSSGASVNGTIKSQTDTVIKSGGGATASVTSQPQSKPSATGAVSQNGAVSQSQTAEVSEDGSGQISSPPSGNIKAASPDAGGGSGVVSSSGTAGVAGSGVISTAGTAGLGTKFGGQIKSTGFGTLPPTQTPAAVQGKAAEKPENPEKISTAARVGLQGLPSQKPQVPNKAEVPVRQTPAVVPPPLPQSPAPGQNTASKNTGGVNARNEAVGQKNETVQKPQSPGQPENLQKSSPLRLNTPTGIDGAAAPKPPKGLETTLDVFLKRELEISKRLSQGGGRSGKPTAAGAPPLVPNSHSSSPQEKDSPDISDPILNSQNLPTQNPGDAGEEAGPGDEDGGNENPSKPESPTGPGGLPSPKKQDAAQKPEDGEDTGQEGKDEEGQGTKEAAIATDVEQKVAKNLDADNPEIQRITKEASKLLNAFLIDEGIVPIWAFAVPSFGLTILLGAILGDFIFLIKNALIKRILDKLLTTEELKAKSLEIAKQVKLNAVVKFNIFLMNAIVVIVPILVVVLILFAACNDPVASRAIGALTNQGAAGTVQGLVTGNSNICAPFSLSGIITGAITGTPAAPAQTQATTTTAVAPRGQ